MKMHAMRAVAFLALAMGWMASVSLLVADEAKKDDAKAADGAAKKLSFHRDVRPILRLHCQGCHQPARPMGKLVLTSYADVKKGGESNEPGFTAGKPDQSPLLMQVVSQKGQKPAMPKE